MGYFKINNNATLWTNSGHEVAVFSLEHLSVPQGFWDDVSADGGNIRVYFKSASSYVPVARDIVNFDPVTKSGLIYFDSSHSLAGVANE